MNNAVVSGEARKTLVGLAGLLKAQTPTAEEGQSGPILGSGRLAQDAARPEPQQNQESSQVNRAVRENEEPEKPDAGTAGEGGLVAKPRHKMVVYGGVGVGLARYYQSPLASC